MSIDGLSMANVGIFRELNPADVAMAVTRSSEQKAETSIKDIEELEKFKLDSDEDSKEEQNSDSKYDARSYDDTTEESDQEAVFDGKDIKRYKVKFNNDVDLIELVDIKTNKVIETITPGDLMKLLSKSKNPSGILVDRQI